MSTALTLIYFVLTFLSVPDTFPDLVPYRIMIWSAVSVLLAALYTALTRSYPYRAVQNMLLLGLLGAVIGSILIRGWLTGAVDALWDFGFCVITYVVIVANSVTVSRLRVVIVGIIVAGLYLCVRGVLAYHYNYEEGPFLCCFPPPGTVGSARVRGLGTLNDPNDFSQFLLVLLPLLYSFWRRRATFRNTVLILLPSLLMCYTIYLTHSRGALLGFLVMLSLPLKSRLGPVTTAVALIGLLLFATALDFTGGRSFSTQEDSAAGRIEAWGSGLGMWKSNPVLGVGFGLFSQYHALTAHNSFVLCFAELGTVGYFFWIALILCTVLDLQRNSRSLVADIECRDVLRMVNAIRTSLYVFLVTAWFLSRTYSPTLYLLIGLGVAASNIAAKKSRVEIQTSASRWVPLTVGAMAVSMIGVYGIVRFRSM